MYLVSVYRLLSVYCCIDVSIEIQIFVYFTARSCCCCRCSHSNERMVCRLFRSSEGVNLVVLICLLSIGYFSTIYFILVPECQNCASAEFLILASERFHFVNKMKGSLKYSLRKAANFAHFEPHTQIHFA